MRRQPIEDRKAALARLLTGASVGLRINDWIDDLDGATVFLHACKLGLEGIVSKRKGSPYRSGRSTDWFKVNNPGSAAVRREAEEDWGRHR